jgi:pimeloyl-ACP methyl ester carboxylesterase
VEDEQEQPEWIDGPPTHTARAIAEHWTHQYDWREVEKDINTQLSQFTVIVQPSASPAQYNHAVPLHFVHHRSPRPDAIPLLFVHGWPGSFLEVADIVSGLTQPPSPDLPAFHVVSPSIPGYGFSPSPRYPGFGYRAAAATFHALMTAKLGYTRYVFQGGDAGDLINRYAAHDFPDSVVSGVSNFWVVPPPPRDDSQDTDVDADDDAKSASVSLAAFFQSRWGYAQLQQTQPLRLAVAMTDSPIGLAMYIYHALASSIEPSRVTEVWTKDRIITWTMMHWLNGPYGAFSLYKQGAKVSPVHLADLCTCTFRSLLSDWSFLYKQLCGCERTLTSDPT